MMEGGWGGGGGILKTDLIPSHRVDDTLLRHFQPRAPLTKWNEWSLLGITLVYK